MIASWLMYTSVSLIRHTYVCVCVCVGVCVCVCVCVCVRVCDHQKGLDMLLPNSFKKTYEIYTISHSFTPIVPYCLSHCSLLCGRFPGTETIWRVSVGVWDSRWRVGVYTGVLWVIRHQSEYAISIINNSHLATITNLILNWMNYNPI